MWVREEARLAGVGGEELARYRAASHTTRAAIASPLTAIQILAPAIVEAAETAVDAAYALRGADTVSSLEAHRDRAIRAAADLTAAARTELTR